MVLADNNVFGVDLNPVALVLAEVSVPWKRRLMMTEDSAVRREGGRLQDLEDPLTAAVVGRLACLDTDTAWGLFVDAADLLLPDFLAPRANSTRLPAGVA